MNGVQIKICGITRPEDALVACEYGANALGFIFVPSSPRYVSPAAAGRIIAGLPPFVAPVGVFVNETRDRINETIASSGIRVIQLHGEETAEEAASYAVPVIKGFRVREGFDVESLDAYPVSAFLLDSHSGHMHGGTGKTFDWSIAVGANQSRRIILGGGLTPQNVAEAVTRVRPYAVDVSSGVEVSPGIKDVRRIKEFIQNARAAAEEAQIPHP
jgi:phosphoribosylanthranilate isomerase